jgi:hypothetical protein
VACALYTPGPTAKEAGELGLTLEEAQGEGVEVWPDNIDVVNVFISLSTQWRVGAAGPVGLDYNVIPFVFSSHGIKRQERIKTLNDLRIMEDSALETMRKARK